MNGSRFEAGISIVEAAIGMALMAIIAASVAATISGTGRALGESRAQEQATQLALEGVEWTRSLSWEELRMAPGADPDDGNIDQAHRTLLGTRFDLPSNEPLVEGGEPAAVPASANETLNTTTFVVRTYVTDVSLGLRRAVVEVTWSIAGSPRRHVAATLISEVSAG